ncbi:hypothetical protein L7F22_038982 [Adiantum nelumboides]|nr:hypothetical protein [Adiantum nelumboides]
MKVFQRWRNQHNGASESKNSSRQRTLSSKGLTSSSSTGNAGYTDPQDVLYPSTIGTNDQSKGGLSASIRPTRVQQNINETKDNSIGKKRGLKKRQSMGDLNRSKSVNGKTGKDSSTPLLSSSKSQGVRVRLDSLMGKKDISAANEHVSIVTNGKEDKHSSGRWGGSIRSIHSPKSKGDTSLPADIVTMPKISTKQNQEVKEDAPLLVVSRSDKGSIGNSPMANNVELPKPSSQPNVKPVLDKNADMSGHTSFFGRKDTGPISQQQKSNINGKRNGADLPVTNSNSSQNIGLSPLNFDKEATLRNSRSSSGLLQTSHDTFYHTPSQRSSMSFTDHQISQAPQSDDRDMYATSSTLKTQSSAFSLRQSRGRISGLFSMKNKSTPGLMTREGSENFKHPATNGNFDVSPSSIPSTPSRSQNLANELNDLAVAFEEGLLGEDEYRLLRKGVFDSMMSTGAMELPQERTIRSSNNAIPPQSTDIENSAFATPSLSSKRSGKSNAMSLFRRSSQKSQPPDSAPGALPSSGSIAGSMASFGTRNNVQMKAALQDQFLQERRARTLRSVAGISKEIDSIPQQNTSFSSHDGSYGRHVSDSRSRIGNSAQSGITQFSAGGLSISSGNALLGRDYTDKSSAEIEAEIAVVEAEGKRLLDNFKTLELHAVGRYDLTFEQIREIVRSAEEMSPASAPADMRDGFIFVSKSEENIPMSPNGSNLDRTTSMFSKRRQSSTSSNSSHSPSIALQASRPNRPRIAQHPPSSFKGRDPHKQVSGANSPERQKALLASDETDESSSQNLKKELIEIHKRRADVVKKYDDRLAFLRSAMRSAKIREGLR